MTKLGSRAAEIGRSYDTVPYDPGPHAALGLAQLRGAATALGVAVSAGPLLDVLDIGCGTGAQLVHAAGESQGRMVGIDASAEACARARARGAALGSRLTILHGDAAGADPAALGQFDVIYLLGTLYIMPPDARAQALGLAAACLKPGGVVVMNYYAGMSGLARAALGRVLRLGNDPAWPVAQQLSTVRANLKAISDAVPAQGVARELVAATIASMGSTGDVVMFHEALGPVLETLHTADLAAQLAAGGVAFINYLPPAPMPLGSDPLVAARTAEAWDFASGGGYRTALFARPSGPEPGSGTRNPALVWATALQRSGDAAVFTAPGGAGVQAQSPLAQAAIEALVEGPASWPELQARASARLAAAVPTAIDAAVEDMLITLWRRGVAAPALPVG